MAQTKAERNKKQAGYQHTYRQRQKALAELVARKERALVFDLMATFPGQISFSPMPAPPESLADGQTGFVVRLMVAPGIETRVKAWAIDREIAFDDLVDLVTQQVADWMTGSRANSG